MPWRALLKYLKNKIIKTMKKGILSNLVNKRTIAILFTVGLVWVYYTYYNKAEPSNGSVIHGYKPYPLNRGIVHHIVYLDYPLLEKPLDLNLWVCGTIVMSLVIIVTVMSIVVNMVSLGGEE